MSAWLEKIRNSHEYVYSAILIFITLCVLVYLFPRESSFKFEAQEGNLWTHADIRAEFSFPVYRTTQELREAENSFRKEGLPIYSYRDVSSETKIKFDSILTAAVMGSSRFDSLDFIRMKSSAMHLLDQMMEGEIVLLRNEDAASKEKRIGLSKDALTVKKEVVKITTRESVISQFIEQIPKEYQASVLISLEGSLMANYSFNQELTDLIIQSEINLLDQPLRFISAGDVILIEGQEVTKESIQNFNAYRDARLELAANGEDRTIKVLGQLLLVLVCLFAMVIVVWLFHRDTLGQPRKMAFLLLMILLVAFFTRVISEIDNLHYYLVPMCIVPIIVRAFYDIKTAILIHVVTVFIVSLMVPEPFEFAFLQVIAGLLLQYGVSNVQRRSQFFAAALVIFLCYAMTYLGINLAQEESLDRIHWSYFGWFAGNTVLTLLAYPFIYFVEKAFGFLSDLRLMEMADTNNGLLRQLNEKAPGTFQHTLQVANLAEEAARQIGANPLLIRVGALYHDIGKMNQPHFFIENQSGVNPHDELEPAESARVIINHVLDGIEMARKAKLHEDIIDFIRTHHGTSKVGYFFFKAKEDDPNAEGSLFTYPGPKPYSKETAILMMADAVEAASRSLQSYSEESLENLINKLIDFQLKEGQFDHSNITLRDISEVKKVFKGKLMNIYHTRIVYPN